MCNINEEKMEENFENNFTVFLTFHGKYYHVNFQVNLTILGRLSKKFKLKNFAGND